MHQEATRSKVVPSLGAGGCWGLWEHRQEGAVLPRQSGLKESEAEQVLKEELEITELCLWSWDDRGEGGLDRDKAGSTGLSFMSAVQCSNLVSGGLNPLSIRPGASESRSLSCLPVFLAWKTPQRFCNISLAAWRKQMRMNEVGTARDAKHKTPRALTVVTSRASCALIFLEFGY